ncbi:DUF6624 domain-containing protein [Microlunatus speluncae]|uniref:DUF6624 domain-containing protein n=1 Tax=Microlunatus speluncae TaxID=2594267 RepID=UPI001C2D28D9|nr:DUF6624 domain-containing protein [Microlunatus speluncae]
MGNDSMKGRDEVVSDPELAAELARRLGLDQEVRTGWPAGLDEARLESVDADNRTWLAAVIAEHGWPGASLVGVAGAHAAWLLAQHADQDPEFQRDCLALLRQACDAGEATRADLAYLDDRVRTAAGEPQRYGTQGRVDHEGRWTPGPIEAPDELDERRRSVGLEPFEDYRRSVQAVVDGPE